MYKFGTSYVLSKFKKKSASFFLKFDCIYGDIWIEICTDNYEEMKVLTKNFKNKLNRSNPNAFIDHWMQGYLKKQIQKEKREENRWWY